VVDRLRWLLLTHDGRVTIAVLYSFASITSAVTYAVIRGPIYGLGVLVLTGFGLFWSRWCMLRPATND